MSIGKQCTAGRKVEGYFVRYVASVGYHFCILPEDVFSNLQLLNGQLGRSKCFQVSVTQLFDFWKADADQAGKFCLESGDVHFRKLYCLHMQKRLSIDTFSYCS